MMIYDSDSDDACKVVYLEHVEDNLNNLDEIPQTRKLKRKLTTVLPTTSTRNENERKQGPVLSRSSLSKILMCQTLLQNCDTGEIDVVSNEVRESVVTDKKTETLEPLQTNSRLLQYHTYSPQFQIDSNSSDHRSSLNSNEPHESPRGNIETNDRISIDNNKSIIRRQQPGKSPFIKVSPVVNSLSLKTPIRNQLQDRPSHWSSSVKTKLTKKTPLSNKQRLRHSVPLSTSVRMAPSPSVIPLSDLSFNPSWLAEKSSISRHKNHSSEKGSEKEEEIEHFHEQQGELQLQQRTPQTPYQRYDDLIQRSSSDHHHPPHTLQSGNTSEITNHSGHNNNNNNNNSHSHEPLSPLIDIRKNLLLSSPYKSSYSNSKPIHHKPSSVYPHNQKSGFLRTRFTKIVRTLDADTNRLLSFAYETDEQQLLNNNNNSNNNNSNILLSNFRERCSRWMDVLIEKVLGDLPPFQRALIRIVGTSDKEFSQIQNSDVLSLNPMGDSESVRASRPEAATAATAEESSFVPDDVSESVGKTSEIPSRDKQILGLFRSKGGTHGELMEGLRLRIYEYLVLGERESSRICPDFSKLPVLLCTQLCERN